MEEQNDSGAGDLPLMATIENYEIRFFAQKNGISVERARELIEQRGRTRAELAAELAS